jgi:hypothetical protein
MNFCDKSIVQKAIEGKRIALVGSAPSVMQNKLGFVDSHDVVIRISNYKLFEETGFRTDVFYSFFGNSIKKTREELIADGVYMCMCKCPNGKPIESKWHELRGKQSGIDFRWIYEMREDFWFCDTYVPTIEEFQAQMKILRGRVPTTGFSAILDVLSYNPKSLYLTGFDFFTSGVHNVDERWKQNNPLDPIGHAPHLERNWLIKNYDKYPIELDGKLKSIVRRHRN